ncbi:hypothetical protein [Dyadobacter sp. CY323]|uniref:hypothetical protein n=1 Tax=Dyadobacter sp. CY323 TaxID=2907302 RepID=UPI001F3AD58A|nr:hypothetical protein [Dyadobacter sp. CY323]MCE6988049.1 hypothetical protein [Dyadobacter sp. CY323]
MEDLKKLFKNRFSDLLESEELLSALLNEVFKRGTAYVVGGYLRDTLQSLPSRDIDFILELSKFKFVDIVRDLGVDYTENRHGGVKVKLHSMSADFWSLEDNWAFKNKLVKLNEADKLNSIAKGCFYNFDSLVINTCNYSYNVRYFNKWKDDKCLDILQRKSVYKNLNPTVEANIIRAVYLKFKYGVSFTDNTLVYIIEKLLSLKYRYNDECERLLEIKQYYPKYNELDDQSFLDLLDSIRKSTKLSNQLHLSFDSAVTD